MCFDGQTLSAYVDDEVSSVRNSSVSDHLETCSDCRDSVDLFISLKGQLKAISTEVDPFTKEAVWTRLDHSTSPGKGLDFWHRRFVIAPSLMISLSFLFIAVMGVGIFLTIPKVYHFQYTANNSGTSFDSGKIPFEIPVDNVENILAYFDIHDEPLEVFIPIFGSDDFVIQGEPLFLRKVDYIAGR